METTIEGRRCEAAPREGIAVLSGVDSHRHLGAAGASAPRGPWAALCHIARLHDVAADPKSLHHALGKGPSEEIDAQDLLTCARQLGLKADIVECGARLARVPLPALAFMRDGTVRILGRCDGQKVLCQIFPGAGDVPLARASVVTEGVEEFVGRWTGRLMLVASRASIAGSMAKFDFTWFIPSLVRYRRLLGEVLMPWAGLSPEATFRSRLPQRAITLHTRRRRKPSRRRNSGRRRIRRR